MATTEAIYDEARQVASGRRQIHDRRGGIPAPAAAITFVVGGATPSDSPFLRRPDLLKSLILIWQTPPVPCLTCSPASLSVRHLKPRASTRRGMTRSMSWKLPCRKSSHRPRRTFPPAWLVDRLLRNMLTDVTGKHPPGGDLHRQNFSPPMAPTGRLGLVEFRGFEMPAGPRACLWRSNFCSVPSSRAVGTRRSRAKPVRWGTVLHDRFHVAALPVGRPAVSARGPQTSWLRDGPGMVSRRRPNSASPSAVRSKRKAYISKCAQALEPWHVLGETGAIGGTVRYTDQFRSSGFRSR